MRHHHEIKLTSEAETVAFGHRLGQLLEPGVVIALNGTLGSGKTRLTQAIAASLDISGPVVSPTYTLCVPYAGRLRLLHMDAYRIEQPEEVDELDLFDRVDSGEVLIVEWAERIEDYLPDVDLTIKLTPVDQFCRVASLIYHSDAGQRILAGLLEQGPAER